MRILVCPYAYIRVARCLWWCFSFGRYEWIIRTVNIKKTIDYETINYVAILCRMYEAMDCDHCIKKIEKNIAFEKGVTDLKCDLSTRTAIVTYKTDKTSKTRLAAAFKKIGMEAVPVDNGAGCPVPPAKKSEHTHAH